MTKKVVHLIFPQKLIKEPVLYNMAKKYDIVTNIRRANVTEEVGEVTLELSGTEANITQAQIYLEKTGVKVEPVEDDNEKSKKS